MKKFQVDLRLAHYFDSWVERESLDSSSTILYLLYLAFFSKVRSTLRRNLTVAELLDTLYNFPELAMIMNIFIYDGYIIHIYLQKFWVRFSQGSKEGIDRFLWLLKFWTSTLNFRKISTGFVREMIPFILRLRWGGIFLMKKKKFGHFLKKAGYNYLYDFMGQFWRRLPLKTETSNLASNFPIFFRDQLHWKIQHWKFIRKIMAFPSKGLIYIITLPE